MYVSLQNTTDIPANAAFMGLERLAFAQEQSALTRLRTAWLDLRPPSEASEAGVPARLADPGIHYWVIP